MASESWERQWGVLSGSFGRAPGAKPGPVVVLDGRVLMESRVNTPLDYIWRDGEPVPRFKEPIRMASRISVIGPEVGARRDFIVAEKVTPGGDRIAVREL